MNRFIIATDGDSAAGNLKSSGLTPRSQVLCVQGWVDHPLLHLEGDAWEPPGAKLAGFLAAAQAGDRLEVWTGPRFDAHIGLAAVADALRSLPALAAKTVWVALDHHLGEQPPAATRALSPSFVPLADVEPALHRLWAAFGDSTPVSMGDLWRADTSTLPHLRAGLRGWLRELPDVRSGLSATEHAFLRASAGRKVVKVREALGSLVRYGATPVSYWRLGEILATFCAAPNPALSGPHDTFSLAMHQNTGRHEAFFGAQLAPTPLGEAILAGREDYLAHNPIDRWWGGVHLTDGSWRWDDTAEVLQARTDTGA